VFYGRFPEVVGRRGVNIPLGGVNAGVWSVSCRRSVTILFRSSGFSTRSRGRLMGERGEGRKSGVVFVFKGLGRTEGTAEEKEERRK